MTEVSMDQTPASVPAVYNTNLGAELGSNTRVDRNITRYVMCIGDHIEPKDKASLESLGANIGGLRVGLTPTEGCPSLRRTNGIILRGAIVPMERVVLPKRADQRSSESNLETYIAGTSIRGYTVYPGDDISYLLSDYYASTGVVEAEALKGIEWTTGAALDAQKHYFPEWLKWLEGKTAAPVLLSDWETFIRSGINSATGPVIERIGEQMIESARLFRQNALDHIERNRQLILSKRSADTGGFYVSWSAKSRLFAKQLGILLEDENVIAADTAVKASDNTELIAAMAEDRKLRMEELEAQREQNRLMAESLKPKKKEVAEKV